MAEVKAVYPDRAFTARKIRPGTWAIEGVGCISYLVIGSEKAMMIDTGMSRRNLKEFIATLTPLPVIVANTHGHFDHTGGNGFFDTVWMHPASASDAKQPFDGSTGWPLDYDIQTMEEGAVFELGGRTLEVIEIPAHNPGSVAFLDRPNGLLFTGDELDPGQVLLLFGRENDCTVERHCANMKKLKQKVGKLDLICPGHNGAPIDPSYIDAFIQCDEWVLAGGEGSGELWSPSFPKGALAMDASITRRCTCDGASILYRLDSIRD